MQKSTTLMAPTKAKIDRISVAPSHMSVGKQSIISQRSKAVPLNKIFKADVQSVKAKNELKATKGEEVSEPERFGRWMLRQDSATGKIVASTSPFVNRSRSVLATIEEKEPPVVGASQQSIDQQSTVRRGRSSLAAIGAKQILPRKGLADSGIKDKKMRTFDT